MRTACVVVASYVSRGSGEEGHGAVNSETACWKRAPKLAGYFAGAPPED